MSTICTASEVFPGQACSCHLQACAHLHHVMLSLLLDIHEWSFSYRMPGCRPAPATCRHVHTFIMPCFLCFQTYQNGASAIACQAAGLLLPPAGMCTISPRCGLFHDADIW